MSASERDEAPARVTGAVSMRDLLASCAAADAVSTPPRAPVAETRRSEQPRKAA
ncbi:hypothetical protein [Streptomyces sp. SAS_270]|uniref:hypothetical protein n=1 Tax=Streptomyces sp. SAS_270 TaxID=3412748 RepID=UPI00403CBFD8